MRVTRIPDDLLFFFLRFCSVDVGDCFKNSGVITICSSGDNDYSRLLNEKFLVVQYALGFLIPPSGEMIPHGWLIAMSSDITVFWDPTLQVHSESWNLGSEGFQYDLRCRMGENDLKDWFKKHYPDREFSPDGIPKGLARFPIIDRDGRVF